ncbi:S-phase kinase-associated protein 1 like protein [Argiope bruennichi]|uniref:S-phase kinase-associated protein 1 like protein n=1 Tax=Argiope bruennichi TaxID=94029 RepID=A0A8T0F8U9_ARGBR|nr:S-phase kinase-associated protein 1 like protein [Argiope bruennichi]
MFRNEPTADNPSVGENRGNTSEVKEGADAKISSGKTSDTDRGAVVKFACADGMIFQTEEKVAKMFIFDDKAIEQSTGDNQPIPVKKINSDIFILMLRWAQKHVDDPVINSVVDDDDDDDGDELKRTDDIAKWDKNLLKDLDIVTLFRLTEAAKFAQMKGFLNVLLKKLASMIKGKTPNEIRKTFNIPPEL